MIPPRAQLTIITPGFIVRDRLGVDEIFRFGSQRRVNGNDVRPPKELGKADHFHAHLFCPIGREIGIVRDDAHADALARAWSWLPIWPTPTMPSTLLKSSTPMNLSFSHLPALTDVVACGMRRLMAQIIDIVFGRRDRVAARRVHDDDPRRVAAGVSTLSRPDPARPTTSISPPRQ